MQLSPTSRKPFPVNNSENTGSDAVVLDRRWKLFLFALILIAAAEFVIRGPARAIGSGAGFNDFLSPYVQTRAWIRGIDPYSPKSLLELWPGEATQFEFLRREVADGSILTKRGIPTAYPLTCFFLLAPLASLPWPVSNAVWAALNVAMFALMIWALISLTDLTQHKLRTYAFVICALALAPFHTGIATANIAVLAVELSVIAMWTASKRYDVVTGILLALAIGLKPQIGLCFLAYYVLRRRWPIFGVAVFVVVAIGALAVLRLDLNHVTWINNYVSDNRALFGPGILSDFKPDNATRFGLINLQLIIYSLAGPSAPANALAIAIAGSMFVGFVWLLSENDDNGTGLLPMSSIAVLSLLPIYHRFYDAALLILPLCWYLAGRRRNKPVPALLGLFLIFPFFLPGGSLLEILRDRGHIPSGIERTWWWNSIVMPHEVWCLLLLGSLLLYEMWSRRSAPMARTAIRS